MNSKSWKKHKSPDDNKNKPRNGGTEVFVLPPNLLEKLGIKLDNIVSTETPSVTLTSDQRNSSDLVDRTLLSSCPIKDGYLDPTKDSNEQNESSILETAFLMKESVFLSPTFVPTVANVTTGEVEIARPYDNHQRYDIITEERKSDCRSVEINSNQTNVECNGLKKIKEVKSNSLEKNENNYHIEQESVTALYNCISSENFANNIVHKSSQTNTYNSKSLIDDIVMKSQTSSLDNNTVINSGHKEASSMSNCALQSNNKIKRKKIEVINEEVVDITTLYRRKSMNPNLNNNVLIPVSMDMQIPTTKNKKCALGVNDVEKNNKSEKVVSLINDNIDRTDTDVKQTEKIFEFVVNNVVEHVDELCFGNGLNVVNNGNVVVGEITNTDNTGDMDKSLVKINNVLNGNLDVENNLGNGYDLYISVNKEKSGIDLRDYSDVVVDSNTVDPKISVDACEFRNLDRITTKAVDNSDFDNLCEFDLSSDTLPHDDILNSCLKSMQKGPVDLDILFTTITEEVSDCSMKSYDEHKLQCLSNENALIGHDKPERRDTLQNNLLCKNNEKEINNCKTGRKSKLCIQGVEKPGGDDDLITNKDYRKVYINQKGNKPNLTNDNAMNQKQSVNELPESSQSGKKSDEYKVNNVRKTYSKKEKKGATTIRPYLNNFVQLASQSHETTENTDSTIDLNNICKTLDFCLCRDFGQLKYYDYDCSYEHIHFWTHKDVTSDRDLIFSMYNVDSVCNHYHDNLDRSIEITQSTEEIFSKICWNELDSYSNNTQNIDECETLKFKENQVEVTLPCQSTSSSSNTTFERNIESKCESTQAVDTAHIMVPAKDKIGAEKKSGVKDRSDIYNKCLEITETNDHIEFNMNDIGKKSESIDKSSDMTSNKIGKKRKHSFTVTSRESTTAADEPFSKKNVKCGVCGNLLAQAELEQHKLQEHGRTARDAGETASSNDKFTDDNLPKIHAKRPSTISESIASVNQNDSVKCGVCSKVVNSSDWIIHICQEHNYLAWKSGESALDLNDEVLIEKYLSTFIRNHGPLICFQCGCDPKFGKKRVKSFLKHIKSCNKKPEETSVQEHNPEVAKDIHEKPELSASSHVKCGVCDESVADDTWIDHIEKEHNYLAWKQGEDPINLENDDEVRNHLYALTKKYGGLICSKCGVTRKYVKMFLSHIKECDGTPLTNDSALNSSVNEILVSNTSQAVDTDEDAKCGVCSTDVKAGDWIDHIGKEHNYMAWKDGKPPLNLDDEEEVRNHLYAISKKYDGLICSKCGIKRKYVKQFLGHIEQCTGPPPANESQCSDINNTSQMDDTKASLTTDSDEDTRCGVCSTSLKSRDWLDHIAKEHNYMAWKDGEPPLNLDDDEEVRNHLYGLTKKHGGLTCYKCGRKRKYVKQFLKHIEICSGPPAVDEAQLSKSVNESEPADSKIEIKIEDANEDIKCGVCSKTVKSCDWIDHIGKSHNYMAWKDGEPPLDLEDDESIRLYLFTLMNKVPAFKCLKCGTQKKYPKSFITHLKDCNGENEIIPEIVSDSGTCQCAMCSEVLPINKWKHHAMQNHYNIAWKVGDIPIDLKSINETEKYLKEYKQKKGNFTCKQCGLQRTSAAGFYAHIITCGKTEEELDEYRNVCEICHNKYLCIYKHQHMAYHVQQEYARERKLQAAASAVKEEGEQQEPTQGRRKAAVKAKNVIEKLKGEGNEDSHTCATCGYDTSSAKKLARHKCAPVNFEGSESEESEESEDFEDNNISDEEELLSFGNGRKRKKNKESMVQAKVPKVPFKYKNVNYIEQSKEDFFKVHFTSDTLFPQWIRSEFERLSDQQISECVAVMEQSCQIKLHNKEWETYNRYEAKKFSKGYTMFTGASVQCVSWAPPHVGENDGPNYLAVSCHSGADLPRCTYDEIYVHNGLIQIWDFGDLQRDEVPKFVMGLIHDYGSIWAIEWCPSGARDTKPAEDGKWARLGLLALACSDGLVHIISVPYPCTVAESGTYLKLKEVAILKLSIKTDRKLYQATAMTWSKHKGHSIIHVGYGDGTVASFDLNNTSPLLQTTENGITIIHPYHDEREHNVCITDLDSMATGATGAGGAGVDAVSSASLSGAASVVRPAAAAARLWVHLPSTGLAYAPGWPTVMLTIDDAIASQSANELEWYGCSRRLGPMRLCRGCARCGLVLLHAPPLLRTLRALPPYTELRKQNVLGIRAIPLTMKKPRPNDELSMHVEPLTYDEVITRYGLEIFVVDPNDKNNSINTVKEHWSERFPLADVTSCDFCATERHHHNVAVGVHAGFVLLVTL